MNIPTPEIQGPFSYEAVKTQDGVHWRVRDAKDNRVATCFVEANAFAITEALNHRAGHPVHWACGHVSPASCQRCRDDLAGRLNDLEHAVY